MTQNKKSTELDGNQRARKHGMYSVVKNGEQAMTPPQKSRYLELKELFESEPGRAEYRVNLGALLAEIIEQGCDQLRVDASQGKNVWTTPGPLKSIGVFINSVTRLLESWPKDKHGEDPSQIIDAYRKEGEQSAQDH